MDTSNIGVYAPPMDHAVFVSATSLVLGEREAINIVTAFSDAADSVGNITYKACTYETAVGEYEAVIEGDSLRLESPGAPKIIAMAHNTPVNQTWDASALGHPSTLGGIAYLMWTRWDAYVSLYPNSQGQITSMKLGGIQTAPFVNLKSGACPSYSDSHQTLYESLNTLAVYVGARAGTVKKETVYALQNIDAGLEINSTVTGHLHGPHNIFETDYWYFLAAAIVEVGCICLVAPTYWYVVTIELKRSGHFADRFRALLRGWWKLGRPLSFSPLELAKGSYLAT